jgi:hypothetical protein
MLLARRPQLAEASAGSSCWQTTRSSVWSPHRRWHTMCSQGHHACGCTARTILPDTLTGWVQLLLRCQTCCLVAISYGSGRTALPARCAALCWILLRLPAGGKGSGPVCVHGSWVMRNAQNAPADCVCVVALQLSARLQLTRARARATASSARRGARSHAREPVAASCFHVALRSPWMYTPICCRQQ